MVIGKVWFWVRFTYLLLVVILFWFTAFILVLERSCNQFCYVTLSLRWSKKKSSVDFSFNLRTCSSCLDAFTARIFRLSLIWKINHILNHNTKDKKNNPNTPECPGPENGPAGPLNSRLPNARVAIQDVHGLHKEPLPFCVKKSLIYVLNMQIGNTVSERFSKFFLVSLLSML